MKTSRSTDGRSSIFEALEARTLLNGTFDLGVSISDIALPQTIIPGDKGAVTVSLTNAGSATSRGSATVKAYASANTTLDSDDLLMGSKSLSGSLSPGQSDNNVSVPVTVPLAATPGNYYVIVVLTSTISGGVDSNPSNDKAVSQGTDHVNWEFGNIAGRSGNAVLKVQILEDQVTFSLTGPGMGVVTPGTGGAMFDDVTVTGSQINSNLTIKTASKKTTSLKTLNISGSAGNGTGSINKIAASTTNIETGVFVSGLAKSIAVGNIESVSHYITVNDADLALPTGATVTISAGVINSCTVNTGNMPIKSFTALNATHVDITAPTMASMTVKSKDVSQGNFSGSLTLQADTDSGLNLGKLTVAGSMDGVTIDTGGTEIGTISAGSWASGSVSANQIKSITVKGALGADVSAAGLTTTKVGADLSGTWSVLYIGAITVGGDMNGASIVMPGSIFVPSASYDVHLKSLTVAGVIRNSSIKSVFPIGAVTATKLKNSNIMLGTSADTMPTAQSDFEHFHAGYIKSLTIKGQKTPLGPSASFVNSIVAAWEIKSASIAYIDTDNSSTAFGLAAHTIDKLKYVHGSGEVDTASALTSPADDSFNDGDFYLTIV